MRGSCRWELFGRRARYINLATVALLALLAGARDLAAIVAVRHPRPDEPDQTIQVVPPCGLCREVLSDHAPDLEVILADQGRLVKCRLLDLLPFKYRRPQEGWR